MSALWGTIVNAAAVLVGGTVGLFLKKGLPKRITAALMTGVGLCTIYIGIDGCLAGENVLIAVLSLALGAVIGEALNVDKWLTKLGDATQRRLQGQDGTANVAQGFVSASLLFCVGAMTVVGSLQSGLSGNHETLYIKSVLDLISSVVFAATFGWGVLLSIVTILVYQGGNAQLAQVVAPLLTGTMVAEMTCVGSLLIIALGLNLLNVTKIKVANLLPAVVLPLILCPLYALIFA
jgi:uncharacterized membrane protein YqgA involved in biofilm formation